MLVFQRNSLMALARTGGQTCACTGSRHWRSAAFAHLQLQWRQPRDVAKARLCLLGHEVAEVELQQSCKQRPRI